MLRDRFNQIAVICRKNWEILLELWIHASVVGGDHDEMNQKTDLSTVGIFFSMEIAGGSGTQVILLSFWVIVIRNLKQKKNGVIVSKSW